jgi:ankyrin repeat protein
VNTSRSNTTGDTALHIACRGRDMDPETQKKFIKLLVEHKASVKARNKENLTPYDLLKDTPELYSYLEELKKEQDVRIF